MNLFVDDDEFSLDINYVFPGSLGLSLAQLFAGNGSTDIFFDPSNSDRQDVEGFREVGLSVRQNEYDNPSHLEGMNQPTTRDEDDNESINPENLFQNDMLVLVEEPPDIEVPYSPPPPARE